MIIAKSYLICSSPRSGSFLFSEALAATRCAGKPEEYFDKGFEQQWRSRLNAKTEDEFFERIIEAGTTANGVFGAKVHWYQLEQLKALIQRLLRGSSKSSPPALHDVLPNLQYIWLYRKDKIRQAISYHKAIKSGVWWNFDRVKTAPTTQPVFDAPEIARLARLLCDYDAAWQSYFEVESIQPLGISYEQLTSDFQQTVINALEYLQIPLPPDFKINAPRLRRQADSETDEWVTRFCQEGFGDKHGWRKNWPRKVKQD